jgi:hypothetical protein
MNWKQLFVLLLAVAGLTAKLSAQGTAFMYQGRLNDNGSAATGAYDLRFALYDAATNGNAISFPQTNFASGVMSGLFNTTLDFGPVFSGTNYWLSIGVRTNGSTNAFTLLWPRQPVLPVPYAVFATRASNLLGTLSATQLVGTLASAQISGTYSGAVNFNNGGNNFSGTFSGNGSALAGLNASQLASGTVADARLTPNVALLDHNQTFTGANNFTSINAFTNRGNYFVGSFFGNGLVGWIPVSGTYTQAMVDAGYLLTNPGLTTVLLPPAGQLTVGDIVRVSGAGAGGWLVAENSGQSILGNFASYRNGYLVALPITTLPTDNCYDIAASADGIRMFAVGSFAGVYASADSGRTWTSVGGFASSAYSIACSANGRVVYAELITLGSFFKKSTNGGVTWVDDTSHTANGSSIACTADGSSVFTGNIACSGDGTYLARLVGGVISVSTNAGSSWFSIAAAPAANLSCLAASSDCTRLVAGVTNGLFYASANRGATWTPITTTNQFWSGAWMSADGSKFAATVNHNGSTAGGIYYSSVSTQPNTISTNSTICGSQGSAVELQYIGNGQFMPVSSAGLLWAN